LAVHEFRALWLAELASVTGDQLARIALALLIYMRTGSATETAVTYALTFVPSVVGGALWSGLADRFPRRRLLVVIDTIRAIVAAGMAWPGLSTPILWLLIIVLSAGTDPYKGAQGPLLAVVLPDRDRFEAAVALRQVSGQAAQVLGFVGGGVLLPLVGPSVALASNAGTFALSAVVILTRVTARPTPQTVRHTSHTDTVNQTGPDRPTVSGIAVTGAASGWSALRSPSPVCGSYRKASRPATRTACTPPRPGSDCCWRPTRPAASWAACSARC
jgi:MFS family permease